MRKPLLSRTAMPLAAAFLLLAGLTGSATAHPAQVTLRWKFNAGESLTYRITTTSETELPGGQGTATSENTMTQRWDVLAVSAEGDATVLSTTERVQGRVDSPMGSMSIDSAEGGAPSNPQLAIVAAQAGTSYTIVMSPTGELKAFEGLEDLRRRMIDAMPAESRAMLEGMLEETFSEESMTSMFQQGVQSFPTGAVSPGDTWDRSFEIRLPMIGTMVTQMSFTLDGIERRDGSTVAKISSSGSMTMSGAAEGQFAGMMSLGNSAIVGAIEFDVERGRLLGSTSASTMEMTLSMGGQQMVMGVVANTKMELVEGGN